MTKNKLGERLKERREELMMTQKDIADNIGVAVSTIQRYESGKIKDIKLPVIDAIANFLKVQPEWLIGKTDIKEIKKEAPPNKLQNEDIYIKIIPVFKNITDANFLNKEADKHIPIAVSDNYSGYIALIVPDDSMNLARICKNDISIIKMDEKVKDGDIVCALIKNKNSAIIRRIALLGEYVFLYPQSTDPQCAIPDAVMRKQNGLHIIGKVISVHIEII